MTETVPKGSGQLDPETAGVLSNVEAAWSGADRIADLAAKAQRKRQSQPFQPPPPVAVETRRGRSPLSKVLINDGPARLLMVEEMLEVLERHIGIDGISPSYTKHWLRLLTGEQRSLMRGGHGRVNEREGIGDAV